MHGRKRSESKALQRDAKVAAKLEQKAVAWHQLQAELLKRRSAAANGSSSSSSSSSSSLQPSDPTTTTTLQLIEKAVTVNPDPLWLWNFRSELLLAPSSSSSTMDWKVEQGVTQQALTNNPKSYGAWHYRKWCLQRHLLASANDKAGNTAVLEQELALTAQFFQRDERNFHCWSYRRFVVSCCLWNSCCCDGGESRSAPPLGEWRICDHDGGDEKLWMGAQIARSLTDTKKTEGTPNQGSVTAILEKEWNFTEEKIRDNFSNFSAFHYRSKLLPVLVKRRRQSCASVITAEFELVLNAVFTEPDDQTAWWYQRFLLDYLKSAMENDSKEYDGILQPHIDQLRELQEEYSGKWVLIGFLQCLQYSNENTAVEQVGLLNQLIETDPDRKQRYWHLIRRAQKEIDTSE